MNCKFLKNAKILYFSSNQELFNSKRNHGCTFSFTLKKPQNKFFTRIFKIPENEKH